MQPVFSLCRIYPMGELIMNSGTRHLVDMINAYLRFDGRTVAIVALLLSILAVPAHILLR
ncbi:hypothetical protein GCM10009720_09160 [Yaniella flava]|uniref:Uncharacterized protein n=1 Tax=Yaniella flava TaxID=287930 RepID=A0ABP5FNX2_9MICC